MALWLIGMFLRLVLKLRYRVKVTGLKEIAAKGTKGILFLPNHPALIDPVIVSSQLCPVFRTRPLVDVKQVRGTILKHFKKVARVLELPDLRVSGMAAKDQVLEQLDCCADALKAGDNVLMYPAGRLYRSRFEKLRANGGVERILHQCPGVRVVLVRTTGLWGSSFSRCKGFQPSFGEALNSHFKHLLLNLLFFIPRRTVTVELVEAPEDFPRTGERDAINRYLEAFYNKKCPPNTFVPYYWWKGSTPCEMPEPEELAASVDTRDVPEDTKAKILAYLRETTSRTAILESHTLGTDLGMDSIMVAELLSWIQDEFGQQVSNPESVRTVASAMLAAIGRSDSIQPLVDIPGNWFVKQPCTTINVRPGDKVTDIFLANAKELPNYPIMADQLKGVVTYRKMVLAIMVLKGLIEKVSGERVGLIMPACLTVNIVYMAMLFAGKVPVLLNWTVGLRNMRHCMENAGVESVLTSRALIEKLEGRGTDFGELKGRFIYLEDIAGGISIFRKLFCLAMSRLSWHSLRSAKVQDICAILFTSGSESLPKTVPILHKNIIADARSAEDGFEMDMNDVALGMLPPFHSFGLLINIIMPSCGQLRVVYHANPLEGDMLARLVAAYKATMLIGTPTFVYNILRNAPTDQVKSVRIIITGAEKCPQSTIDLMLEKCPGSRLNEGYGITECAPIVSLNKPGAQCLGSLGKILPCMEWRILDDDMKPVPTGATGMLYVSGDNVFPGYLNFDGPSPFVELDGKRFYRTGDLVAADSEGFIFFKGRKKRFVKIAGEMVSLPAIEDVLMQAYKTPDGDLPLAVEAIGSEERPEVTLFTILDLKLEEVNQKLRAAGLSPIYNVKHIVKLDAIPLLGSGKTDYRGLKQLAIH